MPLDPHLASVLKMLAAAGRKPTYMGTPDEARAGYFALTVGTRKPEEIVPVGSVEDTTVDGATAPMKARVYRPRSEEHTSELQSRENLVCRLLLEKKNNSHHESIW